MNKLLALAIAVLSTVTPTAAKATDAQQELDDHGFLLAVVDALKVPVSFDSQICKERPDWYGGYSIDGADLALCSRGDRAEWLNTIRHEAWHVYQDLQDCSITDMSMIKTAFGNSAAPASYREVATKHYTANQVQFEAEAAWAADTFSALTIAELLHQKGVECGFKFQ